ncbi:MAG: recombinase family protein [Lachnospiraceae bacterium]|nr:recombinase family protein [Lachnospiraceae bacterium]
MARKSKKIDLVNVNSLCGQAVTTPDPVKAVCYKAALYTRLSEETEANRERATIETQMDLLRKFVAENDDMVISKEYADISYSGTNFERPGFEEMIKDMREGLFNCIVVKDLSRLGRDYVETGNYIERIFPFFDVRFIAVTDGYDSNKPGEELLMPLKNMVNEMYVKDLSKKIRSAHKAYWNNGEYSSSSVPYGYVNVGRHLQPDDQVKGNVQEIFRLFLQGDPLNEIARQMTEKAASPKAYKLVSLGHAIPERVRTEWNCKTVRFILTNRVYVGASVHNKKGHVNGKKINLPEDEWVIIENTHEALVSGEDFDKVQERLAENVTRFRSKCGINSYDHSRYNLFGKKIVCADCGKTMKFNAEGTRHTKKFYRCRTYLKTAKRGCTAAHKVSLEMVSAAVFVTIRRHMELCVDKEETVRRLNEKNDSLKKYDIYKKEADRIRKELQKATEVKAGIFEDYKDGLIDGEQYVQINTKYVAKIKELSARMDEMLKAQAAYSKEYRIDKGWKEVVEQYLGKHKLTREMIEAFVDKVIVHKDARLEISLKYDDMLNELKGLCAERGAV